MIIACTACGAKYKYDENRLGGVISKKVKCPKCKTVIEVVNPLVATRTKPPISQSNANERTYSAVPKSEATAAMIKSDSEEQPQEDIEGPRTAQVRRDAVLAEIMIRGNDNSLQLPEYRRYSLAVIQGYNSGEIFQISKPMMVIGRSDADIIVKDLEASRQHARIDVMGERVILRDLNSTNGTFVNEQKITTVSLENQQEFRIGTTVFMLIITDVE